MAMLVMAFVCGDVVLRVILKMQSRQVGTAKQKKFFSMFLEVVQKTC